MVNPPPLASRAEVLASPRKMSEACRNGNHPCGRQPNRWYDQRPAHPTTPAKSAVSALMAGNARITCMVARVCLGLRSYALEAGLEQRLLAGDEEA
jgi:hypothetical protein